MDKISAHYLILCIPLVQHVCDHEEQHDQCSNAEDEDDGGETVREGELKIFG